MRESITLIDAVPEIVLINSHDGTSAYTLRAGLYRPICTNGMMVQLGEFGLIHVPHRGNVVADVVVGALAITRDGRRAVSGCDASSRMRERNSRRSAIRTSRPGTHAMPSAPFSVEDGKPQGAWADSNTAVRRRR